MKDGWRIPLSHRTTAERLHERLARVCRAAACVCKAAAYAAEVAPAKAAAKVMLLQFAGREALAQVVKLAAIAVLSYSIGCQGMSTCPKSHSRVVDCAWKS
jgi:hypothetical protein